MGFNVGSTKGHGGCIPSYGLALPWGSPSLVPQQRSENLVEVTTQVSCGGQHLAYGIPCKLSDSLDATS